jgi:hypothetical protein
MRRLRISDIAFSPCTGPERATGLLGWFALNVDGLWRFDGIALRQKLGGDTTISFPSRRSRGGSERPYVRPLDRALRAELQDAIRDHLARTGGTR